MINVINPNATKSVTTEPTKPATGKVAPVSKSASVDKVVQVQTQTTSSTQDAQKAQSLAAEMAAKRAEAEKQAQEKQEVEQAVQEMNDYVQNIERDIEFSVDDDTGRTIVQVKDSNTGELIRQIPREEILDIVKSLKDAQGLLFKAKV